MAAAVAHAPALLETGPWFDVPPTGRHQSDSRPGETLMEHDESYNSNVVFPMKMLQVLYDMGYDQHARDKVLQRFQSNSVYVNSPAWNSGKEQFRAMDNDEVKNEVKETVINRLLNKENLKSSGLTLNSNEPVLMIGLGKMNYRTPNDMRLVKTEALHWLRENGIVPCRVYVRSGEYVRDENQFSLMLLNVVNTDIGGPSMIQLLDAAFHEEEWRKDLMSKEAWQGRDLLWIDESGYRKPVDPETCISLRSVGSFMWREVSPSTKARIGSQRLLETMMFSPESRPASPELGICEQSVETRYTEPESSVKVDTSDAPNQELRVTQPTDHVTTVADSESGLLFQPTTSIEESSGADMEDNDESSVEENPSERSVERSHHPAMKELMDVEATKPPIQYPTWTHQEESDSLADLIRQQSSTVKEPEAAASDADVKASQEALKSPGGASEAASEDGFVVIKGSAQ